MANQRTRASLGHSLLLIMGHRHQPYFPTIEISIDIKGQNQLTCYLLQRNQICIWRLSAKWALIPIITSAIPLVKTIWTSLLTFTRPIYQSYPSTWLEVVEMELVHRLFHHHCWSSPNVLYTTSLCLRTFKTTNRVSQQKLTMTPRQSVKRTWFINIKQIKADSQQSRRDHEIKAKMEV